MVTSDRLLGKSPAHRNLSCMRHKRGQPADLNPGREPHSCAAFLPECQLIPCDS